MSREIAEIHPQILSLIEQAEALEPSWYEKPSVSMGKGRSGQPDFLFFSQGILVGIEAKWDLILQNGEITKSKDKLPKPNQTLRLREIKAAGGLGLVADKNNLEGLELFFNGLINDGMGVGELQIIADNHMLDIEYYAQDLRSVTV